MRRHSPRLAALARFAGGILFASGALLLSAAPAAAECLQFDEWGSFRELAPSSPEIIIGRVEAALSEDSADNAIGLRMQVQEVLRGTSVGRSVEFEGIRPLGPLMCPDSVLRVRVGDVIALASDSESMETVTAVAFVEGKPDRDFLPGMEKLTYAEVRRVAAELPPTDVVAGNGRSRDERPPTLALLAGGTALVLSLVWLKRRRRAAPGPR